MKTAKKELLIEEKASEAPSPVNALLRLASCAQLFRGADGRTYARVPVRDRHEFYELRSSAFRNWLIDGQFFQCGTAPSNWAIGRVVAVLEARAQFEGAIPSVFVRVARADDGDRLASYLDLGDSAGRVIEIRTSGWSVVNRPKVHFRRPAGLMPLPEPERGGSIDLLRQYVNLGEVDFRLFVAWLTAGMRPVGPYPPLVIRGEQGSAKTTLARVARLLVDPHSTPLLAEPNSTRDLMLTALNGWLLAYDNIGTLPGWLSDCFCRLAVGGGYATRTLFTNDQVTHVDAQRPLILNGIDDFVKRGDLMDRSVFLNLQPILPADRRTEGEFWASFQLDYPRILAALLDAIVTAIRVLPSIELPELPRMADFACWGDAIGRGLGWPEQSFRSAYSRNRRGATIDTLEHSAVADALFESAPSRTSWIGTCADLHRHLTSHVGKNVATSSRWPKTIARFSSELRSLSPHLRERGLSITFSKNRSQNLIAFTFDKGSLARFPGRIHRPE